MSFQDSGSETLERIFHISRWHLLFVPGSITWKHPGEEEEGERLHQLLQAASQLRAEASQKD